MSDTTTPPATGSPAEKSATRSYFNQAQLDDIKLAEDVKAAALANATAVEDRDIDAAYLTGFSDVVAEARSRATKTGIDAEESAAATLESTKAATSLLTGLQAVQSAAKQKHKMLSEDGDPDTNFATDGYLIGTRLDSSRASLLQSATTLIGRAKADALPGYKKPEQITALEDLLSAYRGEKETQQEATRTKELSRLSRNDLMHTLNVRRAVIQHAADALWPWSLESSRPTRKTFGLPLTRPLGL
ncbi:MAG: hypothetical protein ABIT37_19120 [Luteolibacter sp.]